MAKLFEKAVLGLLVVLVLGIGSVLVTAVATNKDPVSLISGNSHEAQETQSEQAESLRLAPSAVITEEQAKTIAIGAIDTSVVGDIAQIQLEDENGKVVYGVEFTKDKVETDVKVDATNGQVVSIKNDKNEVQDNEEKASNESGTEKDSTDFKTDGIDHEFEGDEGYHED